MRCNMCARQSLSTWFLSVGVWTVCGHTWCIEAMSMSLLHKEKEWDYHFRQQKAHNLICRSVWMSCRNQMCAICRCFFHIIFSVTTRSPMTSMQQQQNWWCRLRIYLILIPWFKKLMFETFFNKYNVYFDLCQGM